MHHLLLGHGLATQRMREAAPAGHGARHHAEHGHGRPGDRLPGGPDAARRADGLGVRIYLDPLVHGRYPADVVADLADRGVDFPVQDGDLR